MKKFFLLAIATMMLFACNPKQEFIVSPTSVTSHSTDTSFIQVMGAASYTVEVGDSCVIVPLTDSLHSFGANVVAIQSLVVGNSEVRISNQKETITIPVTVAPRITSVADVHCLWGMTKSQVKTEVGAPLSDTGNNLYYNLNTTGSIYAAYKFENDSLSKIYVYPDDSVVTTYYNYLNERYFIEVVDQTSAHYYNHFDLKRTDLKVHLGHDGYGWFAEYSKYDPANPYGL